MSLRQGLSTFILALAVLFSVGVRADVTLATVELQELKPGVYLHRSVLQTEDYGLVEANGVVYVANGEALVVDTPCNEAQTKDLIDKIESTLKAKVVGVVIGHAHADSMGGLATFQARNIPSYSSFVTQDQARQKGLPVAQIGFDSQLELMVGTKPVRIGYFGPGHAHGNIVTYLTKEQVLFGGCLIRAKGASVGYLGDAEPEMWSTTVRKVADAFAQAQIVVPGHGAAGGHELLDYTINLFEPYSLKAKK